MLNPRRKKYRGKQKPKPEPIVYSSEYLAMVRQILFEAAQRRNREVLERDRHSR